MITRTLSWLSAAAMFLALALLLGWWLPITAAVAAPVLLWQCRQSWRGHIYAAAHDRPHIAPVMQLRPSAQAAGEYDLLVYGDIGDSWWGESVTALGVVQQLSALGDDVTQINVRINSYGGSVSDGLAIYNQLRRAKAKKVVTVDGVAMSSASLIAMAGDEVLMHDASMLMIHAPWGYAQGNAQDMREMASILDTYASSMVSAYTRKSSLSAEDVSALLTDGKDHYYTGAQAVEAGFADGIVADEAADDSEAASAAAKARVQGMQRYLARMPGGIAARLIAAAARTPRAVHIPVATAVAIPSTPAAAGVTETGASSMTEEEIQAAKAQAAREAQAKALAALKERNEQITAALQPYMQRTGIADLQVSALADPGMSLDAVRAKALELVGAQSTPLNNGPTRVENGPDTRDKLRAAGEQMLLARAGVIAGAEAAQARQGNPFARSTLVDMAEKLLIQAGMDTRPMSREEIARRALAAGQSTGDFPVLLENVLHKTLVGAYNTAAFTWNRFCSVGTLSDYRPHNRYHLSSFSDLLPVGEGGEYKNGVLGDGEKETIQGKRKGRILEITPELLVNDDLGAFTRIAATLGQAAGRTIEKDVYAVLALNGGLGPVMSDGKTLFHADHKNIAGTAAFPTIASLDAIRQQLAQQMDPAGNDYLDLVLAIWLGPIALGGEVRVLNEAQYDVNVTSKFQVPNRVRGLFRDVVDTPRLSGNAWYGFADPNMEPVIEVAFLDGVQQPSLQQETNFRTDGLAWKVVGRYGVGAVGWRGAIRNAGAAQG